MNISSSATATATATAIRAKQERLQQLQAQQAELEAQLRVQHYAGAYEVEWAFPAVILAKKTKDELIQHRLLEAGVLYEVPVSVAETLQATNRFMADLQRTGCFESVQVQLGTTVKDKQESETTTTTTTTRTLRVELHESNWYRLHVGGGIKTDGLFGGEQQQQQSGTMIPTAEVEASIGLRNLTGYMDMTSLQYALDTKSIATVALDHERPLFSLLPSPLRERVLQQASGSQYAFHVRAAMDTLDFERTRSYKEFQRLLSVRASNVHSILRGEQTPFLYYGMEWSTAFRDMVPRRHASLPYALDASRGIVAQSGPNVKHSVLAEFRTNGAWVDHAQQPTRGMQFQSTAELAMPPGDVGFVKLQTGAAWHVPLLSTLSLHAALNTGYLRYLPFGGLCRPPTISDRFYVGGPINLRGFGPAGIGPRDAKQDPTLLGDALGGDFFYTATAMASVAPAQAPFLPDLSFLRLFGFVSLGTAVGSVASTPLSRVLASSRASVGVGISSAVLGPRVEVTYAWPLRYGPRDVRRHFQFGMSFTFG